MTAAPLGPGPLLFLAACVLIALACGLYAVRQFRRTGSKTGVATSVSLALNTVLLVHWPQIAGALQKWHLLAPFVLLLSMSVAMGVQAIALPGVSKVMARKGKCP